MTKSAVWNFAKGTGLLLLSGVYEKNVQQALSDSINKTLKTSNGEMLGNLVYYVLQVPKIGLELAGGLQLLKAVDKTTGLKLED